VIRQNPRGIRSVRYSVLACRPYAARLMYLMILTSSVILRLSHPIAAASPGGRQDKPKNFDGVTSAARVKPVALLECDAIPDPDSMKERGFMWNWVITWQSQWLPEDDPA